MDVKYSTGKLVINKNERGVSHSYEINNEFLITPEAKSLNKLRDGLMENFGFTKLFAMLLIFAKQKS